MVILIVFVSRRSVRTPRLLGVRNALLHCAVDLYISLYMLILFAVCLELSLVSCGVGIYAFLKAAIHVDSLHAGVSFLLIPVFDSRLIEILIYSIYCISLLRRFWGIFRICPLSGRERASQWGSKISVFPV